LRLRNRVKETGLSRDRAGFRAEEGLKIMVRQIGFYIIPGRCVQCHACEVACKVTNGVDLGPRWRRVRDHWDGQFPKVTNISMSSSCMHCEKPACREVCPTGAIAKRAEDGIVVVNQNECIGCRACGAACPYGAPQYGRTGKMEKCNLCLAQLSQGKPPACVATCPGEALGFGTLEDLQRLQAAVRLNGETQPAFFVLPANMGPKPDVYIDVFFRRPPAAKS
jgi:anaerobic dimethyl sulfoxide reductase subunit B (iron-sulfur subunit)